MNAKAKMFVFGTAHEVQGEKFQKAVDDPCYRANIKRVIAVRHVDSIFEEASGLLPSYAQVIANSHSPQLLYVDVDPPRDERAKYHLSADTGGSVPIDLSSQPPCIYQFQFVAAHAEREKLWVNRIREHKFLSGLFICGVSHALSVAFRLVDAGYEVEQCSTYLPHH
jgi:hypothetical protein